METRFRDALQIDQIVQLYEGINSVLLFSQHTCQCFALMYSYFRLEILRTYG